MNQPRIKIYNIKSLPFEVKDVDLKSRQVKIALSAFDIIDADNDNVEKGAFAKSIAERGPQSPGVRKIAHLRNHDWDNQIGSPKELFETEKHLVMVSTLGTSTKGEDALRDYQEGIIKEHSHGFNYVDGKREWVQDTTLEKGGFFNVKEINMFEGSAVTFGANEFTPVFDVAKGSMEDFLTKLNKEMTVLTDALREGKGSDERLYSIEMGLRVIQEKFNSLINYQPSIGGTVIDEPNPGENPTEKKEAEEKEAQRKEFLSNII